MGSLVSVATTYNENRQISVNQVLQQSNTVCFANCENVVKNINFIINNGSRIGDIKITQQCDSNSLCSVKNSFDSVSQQVLDSYQYGNLRGAGGCFMKVYCIRNSTNINTQYLYNTTTQVFNTACIAQASSSATNINVFINDQSSVGGFTIEQSGQATADCTLDNTARAYSSQDASSEQISKIGSGFGLIMAILLITAVIVGIIFYFNTSLKKEKIRAATTVYKSGSPDAIRVQQYTDPRLVAASQRADAQKIANLQNLADLSARTGIPFETLKSSL